MGLRTVFPKNARFKETHWPRRPLAYHGRLSRLDGLVGAPELRSPKALFDASARAESVVELWFDREGEPFRRAAVSPEAAATLHTAGLTVACFGVERYVPAVSELLYDIKCDLGMPSLRPTCHAYLSATGARIRPHFDKQENLVIHLSGEKRWQLAENETVVFPHENHVLGRPLPPGLERLSLEWPITMPERARSVTLRAGSALFVPRGMWHSTLSVATSLSLTILLQAPNWAQSLSERLLERLSLDARFREPVSSSPGELAARSEDFVRVARAVCEEPGDSWVVERSMRPRVRGRKLEASGLSIALDARYVPFVRWITSRKSAFALADAAKAGESVVEAAGVVAFLEEHGVLSRATSRDRTQAFSGSARAGVRSRTGRVSSRAMRAAAMRSA
jgi:50S ribosomal protein L16 3-hydroxylase